MSIMCAFKNIFIDMNNYSCRNSDLLELLLAASRANAGASNRVEDIGELGHLQLSGKVSSQSVLDFVTLPFKICFGKLL